MTLVPAELVTAAIAPESLPNRENPYVVYLLTLGSDESRRAMAGCLDRIAAFLNPDLAAIARCGALFRWGSLRYQDTSAVRVLLQEQTAVPRGGGEPVPWSAAYVNKHLSALRGVLEHAWMLDQIGTDDYHKAVKVKSVKVHRVPPGRSIADPEIASLLRTCLADGNLIGTRDAAMVAVMHSTGMRREELAMAKRADYDPGSRTLLVTGKGNKQRDAHIHEDAAAYLGLWITATEKITGPLFCPVDKHGNAGARHMSPRTVGAVVDKRRLAAGLPHIAPHDFRRTFAGTLLDQGVDLIRVQQLMGHESPATTSLYDRRPAAQRKAAVEKLRLPRPEDL